MNVFYLEKDKESTFQMLNELVNENVIDRSVGNTMCTKAIARLYYKDN